MWGSSSRPSCAHAATAPNQTRTTALSNSMKLSHALWGPHKMDWSWWSECGPLEKGMASQIHHACLENPMNSMKKQKDRTLKDELPRLVGAQYATGDQRRNKYRKNAGMEPKQKQYPAVDLTGDRSKVRCCKDQYCIGTWNVRSMNQGK